ncbi:MAG: 6-phosphofructokinase [Bacteroidales bacterium]|jgi:6-phosphofructokinase 1|nr:6-phosphofructokinase [Bacteroidales bacterium]
MIMVHRIAVLTSGGDAPGMNACIRAVVRAGLKSGLEVFVIYEGYKGLVNDRIEQVDRNFVSDIINRGGTILNSSRLPEFKDIEVQKKAVANLEAHGIDGLIVIGGDGTYRGAADLSKLGINTVALPGTIDNDIASTEYTIGYDTCLNTICECVDKLRDTTASHQRCSFIEVMGNHCGDLGINSGIAEGVEMIITPDHPMADEEVFKKLSELKGGKKKHSLVIVSEKIYPDIFDFVKVVQEKTGVETRAEKLGHLQRGGSPSARDRILATEYGVEAIKALLDNETSVCIGIQNGKMVHIKIADALKMERDPHTNLLDIIKLVNR